MKKKLLFAASICVFLFSCKKNETQELPKGNTNIKKYAVKFNVSDFRQSVEDISGKRTNTVLETSDSLESINNLIYLAYDSTGAEVGRIRHRKNLPNLRWFTSYKYIYNNSILLQFHQGYDEPFGSRVDSLPSGNYTIVVLGSNILQYKQYTINDRSINDPVGIEKPQRPDVQPLNEASIGQSNGLVPEILAQTEDTFYKKFMLTIGSQDISQEVRLERITGKLEVNILDKLPANATQMEFKIYGAAHVIELNTSQAIGNTDYPEEDEDISFHPILLKAEERGMSNYKFSRYLYGRDQAVTVKIQCFDADRKLIVTKNVPDVHIYKNKRTILSGKLFDSNPQTGFTVSVNGEWDPSTIEVPF